MSLRIKLPAKAVSVDPNPQSSTSEPSSRRRKTAKRLIYSDDEDDDLHQTQSNAARSSPIGTPSVRGRSHTVEGDSEYESEHATPEPPHSSHTTEPSSSTTSYLEKHKARRTGDGPPPAKKKRVKADFTSDDEDYHMGAASEHDEEHLIVETKRQPKPTAKAKANVAKGKPSVDRDASTKEERRARHGKLKPDSEATHGTKRPRAGLQVEDEMIDILGDVDDRPHTRSPSQPKEPSEPPPKKRKLPTIKKNKGATTASGSTLTAKASATAAVGRPPAPKLPERAIPVAPGARKTPATINSADFDLRNQSVYNELFKSAGGGTPRSGLSRREKDEERRKELDKMRDEARAKRLADTTSSFDLQAQTDKIIRFEERLKKDHSSALYPNFLAAKWRELWERERRKAKEQGWTEGRYGAEAGEREEGEMNDHPGT
ncbi:hypothetical protein FPV67DRAFT_1662726 [Lyophyllum atratum]|nr:hypothetical protein FPV67DRAFT_1662726 [Lyophyllum atratum]